MTLGIVITWAVATTFTTVLYGVLRMKEQERHDQTAEDRDYYRGWCDTLESCLHCQAGAAERELQQVRAERDRLRETLADIGQGCGDAREMLRPRKEADDD